MKNKSYVEALDKMIEEAMVRLDHLRITRSVLVEMKEVVAPTVQQDKPDGSITIRRVEGGVLTKDKIVPKPPAKRSKPNLELRDRVLASVKKQPQRSDTLIAEFKGPDATKEEKQEIYGALYTLKSNGTIVQDDDRTYRASPEPHIVSEQVSTSH